MSPTHTMRNLSLILAVGATALVDHTFATPAGGGGGGGSGGGGGGGGSSGIVLTVHRDDISTN